MVLRGGRLLPLLQAFANLPTMERKMTFDQVVLLFVSLHEDSG
jgi:hypothetical protein